MEWAPLGPDQKYVGTSLVGLHVSFQEMDISGRSLSPRGRTDLFELPRVGQTTLGTSGCVEEGGFFSVRRPGSASSLTVTAERCRPSRRTQSQVMNAAVHFSLTSSLRFRFFETALGAFPLDKDPKQIWFQNLQRNKRS
jgi:hypothetical protein